MNTSPGEPETGSRRIRAALFRGPGQPVRVGDVELALPKAGEVEVAIAAAGVCHSDLHVVLGEWQHPTPVVLGHEGSGIVTAVGPGVTGLTLGDHVVLSWVPACGQCRHCRSGRPAQCQLVAQVVAPRGVLYDGTSRLRAGGAVAYHYLGVSSFAERAVVPASGAIRVRPDAPLDLVALVGCAVATRVGAVQNTAKVPPQIAVSTTGSVQLGGEPHWVAAPAGGSIPPHSYRWLRVLWRSYQCYLEGPGGSQGTDVLTLRVKVGWITRAEVISLGTEVAVSPITKWPTWCNSHPPQP